MRLNRLLLSIVLLLVALVVQVSVLARLHLPGATPDLLLLTVLGLAMVYGHVGGALVGFAAGLLADLAPPSDHAVGRYALVLCLVGYAAGLTRPESGRHRSATVPMLVVGSAAVSSTLLYAGVGALVGDEAARHVGLGGLLLTATVYDLLLAPFTVPLIMAAARRTAQEPVTESAGPVSGESAYGWLTPGTGSRSARPSKGGRGSKASQSAVQTTALLTRPVRKGRLKGGKRL